LRRTPAPSWASSGTHALNAPSCCSADTHHRWACLTTRLMKSHRDSDPGRAHGLCLRHCLLHRCRSGLSASRFFLRASHSSSVMYKFPSCCNDTGASSNASSPSFNRPVRSATDIVDTSSNVLIAIVICLKQGGRDQSIFVTISPSFTSSLNVVRCTAMSLRRNV
jgi:hypothetical protein